MFNPKINISMKKTILSKILIISLVLIGTYSCAPKVAQETKKTSNNDLSDLPEWVLDPKIKDGVAAVGIAGPSRAGLTVQLPKAELDAKANIAATIQSEISRVTKNALRSGKVNDADDVEEFFAQASKEVVKNLPLSGARRIHMFKAQDGTLYVHMMIDDQDYSKFLKNSQKDYEDKLKKSNLSRDNIDKSQSATKDLFDELEKERGNVPSLPATEKKSIENN
jgi:hypothetical protein